MKKFYLLALPFLVLTFGFDILSDNGKAGVAGSPGENNCRQCHGTFPLNSAGGTAEISSNMPNWEYTPGSVYQISVTLSRPNFNLFGFGLEALNSSNQNAGVFTATNTQVTVKTASNSRKSATHTLNGGAVPAGTGTKTFTFNWTAPATNVGNVTFYLAGMHANGTGSTSQDYVHTLTQVATPAAVSVVEAENTAFSLYPNPVKDFANIQTQETGTLKIFTLESQLLKSVSVTGSQRLDLRDLPSGNYIVQFENQAQKIFHTRITKK